ncbi:L-rhamnose mutarotase [Aliiglaciecola sp. 3_MG-2023]|uniref:L-rhamnose mutarotase n=1 Tax=Aliiglaciecola sp. 3_MG-2023 TaxID=3062644 RepID=UPI0026E1E5D8|nr:L-rhamnose mutarotase [Aliiglaciecola sp. 3_MG-2023]MDO6693129.1 L-rhamnose mutarotase [Aliiglaciecola sp. 3_MG-2023]
MTTTHHVLTLSLNDDPELIRLYEQYHQPGNVWPEVLASIRAAGIENMQIFRLETLLVMVLSTCNDFSFEKKAELDSSNAKVQEWERLMERFQKVDVSKTDSAKWQSMPSIFNLLDH